WSILAHEMGHLVESSHNIAAEVGKELAHSFNAAHGESADEIRLFNKGGWFKELIADAIATRVLGPSYFFAFCSVALLERSVQLPGPKHPSPVDRADFIKWLLEGGLQGLTGPAGIAINEMMRTFHSFLAERAA